MTQALILPSTEASLLKQHTHCRVCKTPLGKPYLNLGEQPLANALRTPGDISEEFRAPLAVVLCESCGLSQLTVVVDPEILYRGYRFRSGTSEAWRKHCADLAEQCGEPGDVLEIAFNDGTQLNALLARGWEGSGYDPAGILAAFGEESITRSRCYTSPWSSEVARQHEIEWGKVDLVIAQNVLGHVDDPIDFLKGIKAVLAEDGQAVIEVPSVKSLIENVEFDTIYHEHLSYWNGFGMEYAARKVGLGLGDIQTLPDIHGGSLRFSLTHGDPIPLRIYNTNLSKPYNLFAQQVSQRINQVANLLVNSRKKKLVAWGASAKGAVMMNAVKDRWVSRWLPEYVIDETPEKVGLLMPGVGIPIVAPPEDLSDVDVIWVLVWNWLEQVKEKARARGFKGQFMVTSPRPALID